MGSNKENFFPRVKEAREALKEKAVQLFEEYMKLAQIAKAAGNLEVAEQILWKLIEHMPNEEGTRLIDPSGSKPREIESNRGPTIQIGIQLGNSKLAPKALTDGNTIDVEATKIG